MKDSVYHEAYTDIKKEFEDNIKTQFKSYLKDKLKSCYGSTADNRVRELLIDFYKLDVGYRQQLVENDQREKGRKN